MQAGVMRIDEFIGTKRTLIIPVYQRNYDWKIENCAQLFDDIEIIARSGKSGKPHFIGTFVYLYNPTAYIFQEFIIIDGQQRITSIMLLAKAIYDLTEEVNLRKDIISTFLKHDDDESEYKYKLCPNEYDRATFEKLMADKFDENDFTPQEKNSALYTNYFFFRKKLSELHSLSLKDIRNAIYQLKVVNILLQDENPQEIFESLNSTGLDLTNADLIRNFLLMPLTYNEQEKLYKNYWLKIEELLRPSDNVENFLIQYLITKRRSDSVTETKKQRLSKRNLYVVFKDYFARNYHATEPCLEDMLRYAKFFHGFIFDDNTTFENLSPLDKKFYELVHLLDANNAPIILMYLLDRREREPFDEATFINFVDALISLTFRAKICGHAGIVSQFAGNVLARLDKESSLDEKIFWRVITFGRGRYAFPNDKEFQEALFNNKVYEPTKSDICRYLLYSLERKAPTKGATELPPFSNPTIEHIWPQKLTDTWKKYLEERNDLQSYDQLLHTLGNLTLLSGPNNSTNSNAPFDEKKKIYEQSNYSYTRALAKYNEWTSGQIQARAKNLAKEAIKIWTLPEEFSSHSENLSDTFTLDSDYGLFTGKKPAIISVFGSEKKVSKWTELVQEIFQRLYNHDRYLLIKAMQMENVPGRKKGELFSTDPQAFSQHVKIDENFFVDSKFDTKRYLRIVTVIVKNFDHLAKMTFMDEIWFTLNV